MNNNNLVCIVGPTSSGKTDLANDLCSVVSAELVNADSKQVYRGIDIIPGKDLPSSSEFFQSNISIPGYDIGYYLFGEKKLWLLDVVTPQNDFSVYDFVTVVKPAINNILSNNKLPIVVGGSGFYISGLVDGIDTLDIPQNTELRRELESYSVEELQERLKQVNLSKLDQMNESDRANPRRLIRAIEVTLNGDNAKLPPSLKLQRTSKTNNAKQYSVKMIGLHVERDEIKKRIDARVQKRIEQGAIEEARQLFAVKENLSTTVMTINGIRPLFEYFENKISKEDALEKWRISEYLNAKKQSTWFKRDKRIEWFDISDKDYKNKAIRKVKNSIKL